MHDVRTRRAGGKRHVDFHLTVPESMSVKESHELCDELERTIGAAMGNATVLIHVEPSIVLPGPETASIDKDGMQKRIDAIGRDLLGADPHVHHLHVFDAGAGTELSFHMTIDPSRSVDEAHRLANEYEERIEAELGFEATIHIEPRRAGGSEGA
jgi:divalent metal cation (Fe/Co/Zn/Cd) transporter